MGKHTNNPQFRVLVSFMIKYPELARGFTRSTKQTLDADGLWADTVKELNNLGPPCRDVTGWKKVWSDYKVNLKKKLKHNRDRQETGRTLGEPNKEMPISSLEQIVIRIIGMSKFDNWIDDTQTSNNSSLNISAPRTISLSKSSSPENPSTDIEYIDFDVNNSTENLNSEMFFNSTSAEELITKVETESYCSFDTIKSSKKRRISNNMEMTETEMTEKEIFRQEKIRKFDQIVVQNNEIGECLKRTCQAIEQLQEGQKELVNVLKRGFEQQAEHNKTMQELKRKKLEKFDFYQKEKLKLKRYVLSMEESRDSSEEV
ncbi:uncharacterized protein LOC129911447 [Episyrphus balteatus]|uniref:uncharacterized protein LOC129911447 n=1 Tax=Episyrphus balteatus TaxID=286459 RepID=UPI002485DC2A|nr:uncharacterized protein LOC129911447 [Episyrphus balteatus]